MPLALVVSLEATAFDAVAMQDGWAALERVAALGYDGVELAVRDPEEVEGARLAERCAHLGLPVVALGTGQAYLHEGLALAAADGAVRRMARERLLQHVRLASVLNAVPGAPSAGVQVIVGLIRGRAGEARGQAERWLREGLRPVLEAAGEAGTGVVLEPVNRYESDWLNTLEETAAFIEQIGHPRLGLLADTFHMNIEERSIEESLRSVAGYLRHVHVADSNRRPPGLGHLDFRRILQVLREAGYHGYLSAETLPYPDTLGAARQTITYLRSLQADMQERRGIS
ncbi:MAG: sugar phosphate isomerase/epimerase family protein [Armatimonadota bacterium]|nr:sugar phosphate isomerase/epimerase family protein [Armatimonadota bacterium]MDR7426280.1 sugar phosphate isomerase/epimerase family protein [Armatimonadota bacterium]MDR7470160.1 sugar phosphate isomerase/epimerase family protein [Armatimonadota bacterium]MDR7473989.1 sugar phosphate isomerase/epimerase family protein [Armatimonadota bacterium]MDR7537984.1 sugar phosphate isomerase/epimerase family protein [Armatimonadota bacterium]